MFTIFFLSNFCKPKISQVFDKFHAIHSWQYIAQKRVEFSKYHNTSPFIEKNSIIFLINDTFLLKFYEQTAVVGVMTRLARPFSAVIEQLTVIDCKVE